MKKSLFTEEQIACALKQAELGITVGEACRKLGIAVATFYVSRKKYGEGRCTAPADSRDAGGRPADAGRAGQGPRG